MGVLLKNIFTVLNVRIRWTVYISEFGIGPFTFRDWLFVRNFAVKFQHFLLLHRCTGHLWRYRFDSKCIYLTFFGHARLKPDTCVTVFCLHNW